jgi:hypothetical protein
MKISEIAQTIGAKVLSPGNGGDSDITNVWAGDKMSDLLNAASSETLLVTHLNNQQLIRAAELMDIPAICFLGGSSPDDELIKAINKIGTVLLSSPFGMYETCGRLYQCLKP